MGSRIRITGGQWRSRLVQVINAPGLRPTPDRVRETLFNWLGQDLSGMHCVDLFAGTGILGFEAASRGAAKVTLIENQAHTYQALCANAATLDAIHAPRLYPVRADALKFAVCAPPKSIDLLFLDPPYRQGWLAKLVDTLPQLAAPGMRIYAEAEYPLTALGAWRVSKEGRAGQVYFHLLEHAECL